MTTQGVPYWRVEYPGIQHQQFELGITSDPFLYRVAAFILLREGIKKDSAPEGVKKEGMASSIDELKELNKNESQAEAEETSAGAWSSPGSE